MPHAGAGAATRLSPQADKDESVVVRGAPPVVEKPLVAGNGLFDVRKCVDSACWLEADLDDDIRFKFRIVSFEKLEFDYDIFAEDLEFDFSDGVLWLLVLQIVNLTRRTISCDDIKDNFRIVDSDDFHFEFVEDRELCCSSELGDISKLLKRFYHGELRPKLTATGGLLFLLPDENTNYFIGLESGKLTAGCKTSVPSRLDPVKPVSEYTESHHIAGKPNEIVELYRALDHLCQSLAPGRVRRAYRKKYVSWSREEKIFCSAHLLQRGLRVWLVMYPRDINPSHPFARDVSRIGHWGTGDVELAVDTLERLHDAEAYIRHAFENATR